MVILADIFAGRELNCPFPDEDTAKRVLEQVRTLVGYTSDITYVVKP